MFFDKKKRLIMQTIYMPYVKYVNFMPLSIMMMYFCIERPRGKCGPEAVRERVHNRPTEAVTETGSHCLHSL